ncbi:MAG TPA: bifunctional GNAT family N-acetyltransferase/carbon-nitrogen hydrolase family protein [Polyangiaceae bacterium LLY-WYZ-15_(1-7)]|nr:carbon-nitrogen hydrolase [Sandaracinus sp.]HJK94581.1 bifunctional GNAT family N-acetyltransferase/carbon-nitrogen hydrolase family protein [Polyangiaceae bacterium LLY-WYZ-15_(1-7)]MBJ69827.1 carbon-nitrogen hydrolase [Sandaracinus sp.]HJL02184.1 bifunctional GNAT family N-acetyltransferase/carbon-nitrogen hydrolase family protein [Polyangiaceae bacterium LLY-WYZ-15_(1-7)]HJL13264.1 bifunctional GNAT family N-acetyltransferase/carbon-nitrogen hydrolase family protein [Polyangiaceae bacteri
MNDEQEARLVVRQLEPDDIDAVVELQRRCFPDIEPWNRKHLEDHVRTFPEGQIGVELDGELVASSSSLIVSSKEYDDAHTFTDIVPKGLLTHHDPSGDVLYGIDIVVSPDARGMRLARRIYDARKELVQKLELRKIVIAGRMPRYHEHAEALSAREYVRRAVRKEIEDPVLTAQLANGFVIRAVLDDYLPSDQESRGHAVLMEWLNPRYAPSAKPRARSTVRVAAVQYQMRPIESFEDFAKQTEFFAETASEYRADFLVFPELLTNQLLGLIEPDRPGVVVRELAKRFTEPYVEHFSRLAIRYNVNIIGGTHLVLEDDRLYNDAFLFQRDGAIDRQRKIHVTPAEARWWGVEPGNEVRVFDTDRGKVAIAICYDVEFPEVARRAKELGARLLFVPYNTDIRSGHIRVRTCAHARAIENHLYAVLSGACGNLPFVEGADIHWAQSCILTPSDLAFDRDGVAVEATPNVEAMLVHELDLEKLKRTERTGTVRTWVDRRDDLYGIEWRPPAARDGKVS